MRYNLHRGVADARDDAGGVDFSIDKHGNNEVFEAELAAADELREESDESIVSIRSKGTLKVAFVFLDALCEGA